MKKTSFYSGKANQLKFFALIFFYISASSAQVGIGTETPESSSILDISSTSKGILVPRMTENQKNAISSPAQGLLIYQTNGTKGFYSYNGSSWLPISSGATNLNGLSDAVVSNQETIIIGSTPNIGTTARYSTGVGKRVLESITEGDENVAMGHQALGSTTTGSYNTAMGSHVNFRNTTGNYNSSFGVRVLENTTTGSSNTGIGSSAGDTNTTGSNNTFIGRGSDADVNNLTNATAIGYNAIVDASNKIQLGDSNVTNVETSGTVTIGAITIPNTDGSANQVLKTDGSGSLSWTTMSSSSGGGIIAPEEAEPVTLSDSDHGKIFFSQHSSRPAFPDPDTLSAGFTCTIVNYSNYDGTMTSPSTTIIGTRSNSMYPAKDHAGVQQSLHANNIGGRSFPVSKIGFSSGGTIQIRVITISGSNYYYVTGDFYYN